MPFHLIRGTFHVVGYSPDGDSIRFQADDREQWKLLDGPPVDLNARGHAQLRIEAIDTLETHYQGHHQPLKLANKALRFLLDELGIKKVKFDQNGKVISARDGTRGYILSRKVEKNRRPVSFVFAGEAEEEDGAPVFLRPDRLEDSVNYKSALAGLAYPTYYTGLFSDLRKKITAAVTQARKGGGKGFGPRTRLRKVSRFQVSHPSPMGSSPCPSSSDGSSASWEMEAVSTASRTISWRTRTRCWNSRPAISPISIPLLRWKESGQTDR